MIGLSGAAVLLLLAVWPRELDEGPDIREFWESFGGQTELLAGLQMLSEGPAPIAQPVPPPFPYTSTP
jgi:hypothetical protein